LTPSALRIIDLDGGELLHRPGDPIGQLPDEAPRVGHLEEIETAEDEDIAHHTLDLLSLDPPMR
jgi:hypothetical protein